MALPRQLLETIKNDVRSITGQNLRKLMILAEKTNINQLNKNEEFEPYSKIDKTNGRSTL